MTRRAPWCCSYCFKPGHYKPHCPLYKLEVKSVVTKVKVVIPTVTTDERYEHLLVLLQAVNSEIRILESRAEEIRIELARHGRVNV